MQDSQSHCQGTKMPEEEARVIYQTGLLEDKKGRQIFDKGNSHIDDWLA